MSSPGPYTNPYAPPSPYAYGGAVASQSGAQLTAAMIDALRGTRPWVVFLAVLAFIGAGFSAIGGVALAVMPNNASPSFPMGAVALIYVASAVFYAFIGWRMIAYSGAMREATTRADIPSLELVLDRGRSLWMTFGIITIVGMVLGVVAVGVAVATAANRGSSPSRYDSPYGGSPYR